MVDIATSSSIHQYAFMVVKPALQAIHSYSYNAMVLVTGTAYHESHLHYLYQIGGRATGFFQIEKETWKDLYQNYLPHKPVLRHSLALLGNSYDQLIYNIKYAAAICRIIYLRHAGHLPPLDAHKYALIWKEQYNTSLGKGDVVSATRDFQIVIDALKIRR